MPLLNGTYLEAIQFNDHDSDNMPYDDWSIWNGSSASNMSQNAGIGMSLQDNEWYGVSWGWANPSVTHPATPIPAYSSQWYSKNDITTWLGTGVNQSLVVIDYGTETNGLADSFVFGIQYNGSITAEQALTLIQTELNAFNYTSTGTNITNITIDTV